MWILLTSKRMHPLSQKGVVGIGVEKGCYYLWYTRIVFCNWRDVLLFCSPKSPFFKIILSFLVFFFFFCHPSQNSISVVFCINPSWENIIVLLFCSIFLLPFLSFASFFQATFPDIPFSNPQVAFVLAVWFFCSWCFDCFRFHFIVFFFFVSFCWFLLRFCCVCCFASKLWQRKRCFPCNSCVLEAKVGAKPILAQMLCLFVLET